MSLLSRIDMFPLIINIYLQFADSGLRIQNDLFRIRIRIFYIFIPDPDPDPDPTGVFKLIKITNYFLQF